VSVAQRAVEAFVLAVVCEVKHPRRREIRHDVKYVCRLAIAFSSTRT
jgi:hypothetical protein